MNKRMNCNKNKKNKRDKINKASELMERASKVMMNTYQPYPIVLDEGKGSYAYDIQGKKYLDFASGIAVNALGYGQDGFINVLSKRLEKGLLHCSNLYYNEPSIMASEKLIELSKLDKVFFSNSGAEAIEGAMKLARKYGKAYKGEGATKIIAMKNSFHGRSYGAVSLTGQEKYQKGLSPLVPDIIHVPFNNFQELSSAVDESTCAIIMEPIQGEGGIIEADKTFVKEVRDLCDEENIVLIFDEVQTGVGRTGKWFAYEHFEIVPDIVALAKGLGGGLPVGAFLACDKVAKAFSPGDHASTYGGNPLVTSGVLKVLETIEDEHLLDNVNKGYEYMYYLLSKLQNKLCNNDSIRGTLSIRGKGLLVGIQMKEDTKAIIRKSMEKGLLLVPAGADVIRLLPPLNVSIAQIDEAITILYEAIEEVCQ